MSTSNIFDHRFLALPLIAALAFGCKFGTASSENVVVDKVSPSRSPTTNTSTMNVHAASPTRDTANASDAVCPDPAKPCDHKDKRFDEWELSFKLPSTLKPNTPYSSSPFYAIILRSYPIGDDCDGGEFISAAEVDRKREQADQPGRKVFASYECPNMSAVNYEFDGRWNAKHANVAIGNFIAVYAGTSRDEAEQIFSFLKAKYPNATIKEMRATYEMIEQ